MTLVVESDDVEQVAKQLYRLVDVLNVDDVTDAQVVEREMLLIRVARRPAPACRTDRPGPGLRL